jgi:hypothetical protein
MPEIIPRYEFRIFAENLVPVFQTLKEMAGEPFVRESDEVYIVSEYCWDTNFKIRDGKLDIKVLLQEREGLEQWMPKVKMEFPLERVFVKEGILDDVLFESEHSFPELSEEHYAQEELIDLVNGIQGVKSVQVTKKRYVFKIRGCFAEFAEIMLDGKTTHTLAVEGAESRKVLELMKELDIHRRENVNYPLAIRRRVGLEPEEAGEHC